MQELPLDQAALPINKTPHDRLFKDVGVQGGWAWILNLAGSSLRYFNTLLLARMLGPWGYGLFSYAVSVVTVSVVPASLGMGIALVHFLAGKRAKEDWASFRWFVEVSWKLSLAGSLAASFVVFFGSGWIAESILHNVGYQIPLAGLALSIPFLVLFNLASGGLQGLHAIRRKVFIERVAHPLLYAILLAGLAWHFPSLEMVAACFFLSAGAVFAFGWGLYWSRLRDLPLNLPPRPAWRDLFRFSVPVLFLQLLNYLILWSDVLVMGLFASPSEVGIYTVASRLATAVNMPTEALSASLAPSFSALTETGDRKTLGDLYRTSTRWIFLASTAIALGLILGGEPVLRAVRHEYAAGFSVLVLLSLGQALSGSFGANGTLITMTGHPKVNLVNAVFFGLGNLGLMFLLVPRYGAIGAATAAALSLALVNVVRALEIWALLRIAPWDRSLLKPLAALLAAAAGGAAAARLLHPLAGLTVGLPGYALLWLLLGPAPEERELLRKFAERLGWRRGAA